jgi:hypothetical protein
VILVVLLLLAVPAAVQAQTPRMSLIPFVSGLSQPVLLTTAKDGSNRRYIVEQIGRIRVVEPDSTTPETFLDIRPRVLFGGERGLLGLAFHPQYSANRRFFVNYTRQPDGATVVAEYLDGVERILFVVPQPFDNHNGGMIEFGPDGYLYIGMGDGGAGNDPGNRAQNPGDLLGKMLRINVDIPDARPEIFASGLRNPWRFSFDRLTGEIYAGDVGQNAREEIDIIVQGGNYGWRVFEGTLCTGLGPASCSSPSFIPPITEYVNTGARCSVTGGYVYRGEQATLPSGAYVFGDFCSGEIFMFKDGVQTVLLDTILQISSFGEDEAGELYVVNLTGTVSQLVNLDVITAPQRSFTTGDASAFVASTAGVASTLTVGYGRIQADAGQPLPAGLAIFGFRRQGVLVTEASVPASRAVSSGLVFMEIGGGVNTGVALANPNDAPATVTFNFTNAAGGGLGGNVFTIPARRQIAAFLNEAPFNAANAVMGAFSFSSSLPIAAIALRGFVNERGDFLITTLPFVEPGSAPAGGSTIAHFANGGGWTTQVVLVNPSDVSINGTAEFVDPSGAVVQTTPYALPARGVVRIVTSGAGPGIQTGSVRLSAAAPAISIFSYRVGGVTVSQTGAPAVTPSQAFRSFVESGPGIRSGIAIANPGASSVEVSLSLNGLSATLVVPARGQLALFVNEIPGFANLPTPLRGVMRISAPTAIVVTGLRTRTNERGEFFVTTTTPVDETTSGGAAELFFPHFAEGGGYRMQFILFGRVSSGTVYFFDQAGDPVSLLFP